MHMYVAAAQLATQHGSTVPWIWPQWSFDTNPGFGFVAGWVMAMPCLAAADRGYLGRGWGGGTWL